jgi:hypothetical protein
MDELKNNSDLNLKTYIIFRYILQNHHVTTEFKRKIYILNPILKSKHEKFKEF